MKFTIAGKVLASYLSAAAKAIKANSTSLYAGHVLIEASPDGILHLHTADTGMALEGILPAAVDVGGICLVQGDKLASIANAFKDDFLTAAVDVSGKVTIRAGKSSYVIPAIDTALFPRKARAEDRFYCSIDSSLVVDAISRAMPSVSRQDSYTWTSGVILRISDGRLMTFSADGHRMFEYQAPLETGMDFDCVIPRRGCEEIVNLEVFTDMAASLGALWFKNDNLLLSAGLMMADQPSLNFDSIEQFAPVKDRLDVNLIEWKNSLKRLAVVLPRSSGFYKMTMAFHDGQLVSSITDGNESKGTDAFEVPYHGQGYTYALNFGYLQDALDQLDRLGSDTVALALPVNNVHPLVLSQSNARTGVRCRAAIMALVN